MTDRRKKATSIPLGLGAHQAEAAQYIVRPGFFLGPLDVLRVGLRDFGPSFIHEDWVNVVDFGLLETRLAYRTRLELFVGGGYVNGDGKCVVQEPITAFVRHSDMDKVSLIRHPEKEWGSIRASGDRMALKLLRRDIYTHLLG